MSISAAHKKRSPCTISTFRNHLDSSVDYILGMTPCNLSSRWTSVLLHANLLWCSITLQISTILNALMNRVYTWTRRKKLPDFPGEIIFPRCILHFRLYLVWSSKTYQFCKSTICYTPAFNFPVLKCTYNADVFFSWCVHIGNGATIDRMRERPILGQVQAARETVVFHFFFIDFSFFMMTDVLIYEKVVYYLLWFVKYFVVLYE